MWDRLVGVGIECHGFRFLCVSEFCVIRVFRVLDAREASSSLLRKLLNCAKVGSLLSAFNVEDRIPLQNGTILFVSSIVIQQSDEM